MELKEDVVDRSFQVVKTNRDTVLAQGHHMDFNGIVDTSETYYRVYKKAKFFLALSQLELIVRVLIMLT